MQFGVIFMFEITFEHSIYILIQKKFLEDS